VVPWQVNPGLASSTAAAVNDYRTSDAGGNLPALAVQGDDGTVGSCVKANITSGFGTCDPGNLAEGYTTGDSVVKGWIASPGHRVRMVYKGDTVIICVAYSASDGSDAYVGCAFGR